MSPTPLIDVHAHVLPDYVEAAVAARLPQPDGMPGYPAWSEGAAIDAMDRLGECELALLAGKAPMFVGHRPCGFVLRQLAQPLGDHLI